jgi:stage II sporulation protein R
LEDVANSTLTQLGSGDKASVFLTKEAFGIRQYDTFSLPSGVYDSLRIEIGQAKGRNWWCVVFPALCLPTTTDGFEDVAASAGFNESLTDTLTTEDGYEIRFYLLDCIGRLENIIFS